MEVKRREVIPWGERAVLCALAPTLEIEFNQPFFELQLKVFNSEGREIKSVKTSYYTSWTVDRLLKECGFKSFTECWRCNAQGERTDARWPFEFALVVHEAAESELCVLLE